MKSFFTCRECVDLLIDYLEQNLDPATARKLEDHMAACPPCLNFLKSYKACSEMARKLRDQDARVPSELQLRLKSFLHDQLSGEA